MVDGVADWAASESGAMDSLDSSNSTLGQASVGSRVGQRTRASVAIGVHPELGVRVNVHVELDALALGKAIELSLECLGLDTVASRGTLVVLSARRGACTLSLAP